MEEEEGIVWAAVATAAALAAGSLARKALYKGWRARRGFAPSDPVARDQVTLVEVVLFGAATGAVAGLARFLVERVATKARTQAG